MPTFIDTQKAFRRLREDGGFSDEQADAIVDLFRDAGEEVATRSDVDRLEARINALEKHFESKINSLDEGMEKGFETTEERLGRKIQKVRSSIVASVAAVGAVLAVVIPLAINLIG